MYVVKDSDGYLYPADRCRFKVDYHASSGQYRIDVGSGNVAGFYDGSSATPVGLSNNANDRPVLGYLGKSGRFVPMTGD